MATFTQYVAGNADLLFTQNAQATPNSVYTANPSMVVLGVIMPDPMFPGLMIFLQPHMVFTGSGLTHAGGQITGGTVNVMRACGAPAFAYGGPIVVDIQGLNLTAAQAMAAKTTMAGYRAVIDQNAWTYTGTTGEDRFTGGTLADTLNGGGDDDVLAGGGGNDTINGGVGRDTMRGGADNDTYIVDSALDTVIELAAQGIDTVRAALTWTLKANLENLTLTGIGNGTGNSLANKIIGSGSANRLDGGANDDTLSGFAGNDTLTGGLGKDVMTGGTGSDIFKFTAKTHSVVGANADRILDFDDGGAGDKIDVSALFGPKMTYRHGFAFTDAGQVRINDVAGADVVVEVNTGGTLAPDFSIRLVGTTLASMNAADFVL